MDNLVIAQRTAAPAGWRIDPDAIREALDMLGVSAVVKVRLSKGTRRIGGTGFRAGAYEVQVSRYGTAERATETLWHELTHVRQAESAGGFVNFVRLYKRHSGLTGVRYAQNPYEKEAREVAERFADCPLVKNL